MSEKIVYCYYQPNSFQRPDVGKFEPFNIDPNLCTHLGYYRFGIHENGIVRHINNSLDTDENLIGRVLHLKRVNPNLKVLAVFGGWDEGSEKFAQVAADPVNRTLFIQTAFAFCDKYGFDGIDLDWCYPGKMNSNAFNDKRNFTSLIREMREKSNGHLIFLSVGATRWTGDSSYEIRTISSYADILILKTYDFHGAWEGHTGANTPLYDPKSVNISDCVNYWIKNGAPESKLLLGLAFYGQTCTLQSVKRHGMGEKTIGKGVEGQWTKKPGNLAYQEIVCNKKYTVCWDDNRKVPYAHFGDQWVSYDDPKSIQIKCQFVKAKSMAGVAVFAIDYDDFLGLSGTIYPLLNSVRRTLSD
ncbi:CHIA.2 family protein [Megaselia abdita]